MDAPKYRKHSSRDKAFVEWQGKRKYLPGRYNSQESKAAYKAFLEKNCGIAIVPPRPAAQGLTVMTLCATFLAHLKASEAPDIYHNYYFAVKPFAAEYGHELAAALGPLALKRWQAKLAERELSRGYISGQITYIRQAFRWGVSEELIPASVWHALQAVQGLKAGKTAAKERRKRQPVPWSYVEAVLPFLTPHVRAMVLLQWYTGVRSQSVCKARPSQFRREGGDLIWSPRHKGESRGIELHLPIGPRAQAVLAPFLADSTDRWLFSPRAISNNRRYGEFYLPRSYGNCVKSAIERLNESLAETNTPAIRRWTPHQLRHSKGHAVSAIYGLEGVQAVLGHAQLSTSEVYSQKRLDLARIVAAETG